MPVVAGLIAFAIFVVLVYAIEWVTNTAPWLWAIPVALIIYATGRRLYEKARKESWRRDEIERKYLEQKQAAEVQRETAKPSLPTAHFRRDIEAQYRAQRQGKSILSSLILERVLNGMAKYYDYEINYQDSDRSPYGNPHIYPARVAVAVNQLSMWTDRATPLILEGAKIDRAIFSNSYPASQFLPIEIPFNFYHSFIATSLADLRVTDPVPISEELWYSSTWICAPQGKGKTNLLHNIIKDRYHHGAVIMMDAKGELTAPYLQYAHIIEPDLENPPQINPLDFGTSTHAVELIEYIFSSLLESKMTALQSTMFSAVITLLTTIEGATLETFREVLTNGWKRYQPSVEKLKPRDADFFLKGEFDSKTYGDTKTQVLWRLRLLLRNEHMAAMLEAPKTQVDMGALMNRKGFVVIDNNPDILGDLGAEFFGRLMIALMWSAVRARTRQQGEKLPVYFIIDEAQTVIYRDETIPKLIDQCRSQKVALIFAHQRFEQMKSVDVQSALSNCAIKIGAPDAEASMLAPRFNVDADFLKALPPYHFALAARGKPTVSVTVPHLPLKATQKPPRPPRPAPPESQPSWRDFMPQPDSVPPPPSPHAPRPEAPRPQAAAPKSKATSRPDRPEEW